MNDIYEFFKQIFIFLHTQDHQIIIMAVYISCFAFTLLLRLVTCMYFRSLLLGFKLEAKKINNAEDVKNIRFGILRKLAADYMQIASRNASRIPTQALTDRQLSRLSLMGWRYVSIMPFVELLESGLLWVGLIIAVLFDEYAVVYGILAVIVFLLTRLAAAFFDFRSAYENVAGELYIYTERELGALYPIPISGNITPTIDLSDASDKIYTLLSKPLEEWAKTMNEATVIQHKINESASKMLSAAESLAKPMEKHGEVLAGLAAEQNNLLQHAKMVEQNQHALENAYQSYEKSLQSLVQTMGDGLGTYLKLHGQSAAQSVNDAVAGNIEKMMNMLNTKGNNSNG